MISASVLWVVGLQSLATVMVEGEGPVRFGLPLPAEALARGLREWPERVRFERVRQLGPMDQIGADRVAPGHVVPPESRRIVLEEEMPLAVVIDHAIWIVQPAHARDLGVSIAPAAPPGSPRR